MAELICIKTYNNRYEAELAKGLLETNNIIATILADDAGGMRPHLLLSTGGVRLLVREKDSGKALEILK